MHDRKLKQVVNCVFVIHVFLYNINKGSHEYVKEEVANGQSLAVPSCDNQENGMIKRKRRSCIYVAFSTICKLIPHYQISTK